MKGLKLMFTISSPKVAKGGSQIYSMEIIYIFA